MRRSRPLGVALLVAGVVAVAVLLLRPSDDGLTPAAPTSQPGLAATTQAGTQPGVYLIGGYVKRPGAYNMDKPITLRELIVVAGVLDDAKSEGNVIVSRTGKESGEMIRVELGPLMRDKTGDIPLVPNDNVMVR